MDATLPRPFVPSPLLSRSFSPTSQTLYSFEGDFRAFKAAIAAEYNGITLARKNVDLAAGEQKTPAFLAKSPLGKVPVLETESGTLTRARLLLSLLPPNSRSPSDSGNHVLWRIPLLFVIARLFSNIVMCT